MIDAATADATGTATPGDEMFSGDIPEWSGLVPSVALSHIPASAGLAMELEFGVAAIQDLTDTALEDVITSYARIVAWAQAHQSRALVELARRADADPRRQGYVVEEIATTLHLSGGMAGAQLSRAIALDTHLVATRELWEQGVLDERRVSAIVEGTHHLTEDVAVAVEARVLPRAPGQTAAQLRAAVKRAVIAADPAGAQERADQARITRGVHLYPEPDGMATITATMTAADGVASYEWLSRLARGLGSADSVAWTPADPTSSSG